MAWGDAEGTATVGTFVSGISPYKVFDMAGNVWEWCADWYDNDYTHAPLRNPTGPDAGTYRVLSGGSWNGIAPSFFRCANRFSITPEFQYFDYVGFRFVMQMLRP